MGYQEINTFLWPTFLCARVFLSIGNIVGVVMFTWGRIWGTNICLVVTKFEITVLGVPKLQKMIHRNGELSYLPHFAEA